MLKSLQGIEQIGGYDIVVMDDLRAKYPERFTETGAMDYKWFEETIRPNKFIYVRHDKNSISFTIQNGPVKENGLNGCQVDTIIETALAMIKTMNKEIPCRENSLVITKLEEAVMWLEKRKTDRTKRMVEGTSNS